MGNGYKVGHGAATEQSPIQKANVTAICDLRFVSL